MGAARRRVVRQPPSGATHPAANFSSVRQTWTHTWTKVGDGKFQGGQGNAFIVNDATNQRGFLKQLIRPRDLGARKRFLREVTSYKTLDHECLPTLLDDNTDEWSDRTVELFMVLEFIEGGTLGAKINNNGPMPYGDAVEMTLRLADTLEHCHNNEVVHRDLKPENVLLRGGLAGQPVVVDFGLSFNTQDPNQSDLTRINEEVGNRFLRLPEHSTGGRSPVSDVTQLVGLLFFALTGLQPRVLVDAEGRSPHERADGLAVLNGAASGQTARRLMALFDRAFASRMDARIQTAAVLRELLEYTMEPEPDRPDLEGLLKRLDDSVAQPSHADITRRASLLQTMTQEATAHVRLVASERRLNASQGGGPDELTGVRPFRILRLALCPAGVIPDRFVEFKFEFVGADDVEVSSEGSVVWRGPVTTTDGLRAVVVEPVVRLFLDVYGR